MPLGLHPHACMLGQVAHPPKLAGPRCAPTDARNESAFIHDFQRVMQRVLQLGERCAALWLFLGRVPCALPALPVPMPPRCWSCES